MGLWLFYPHIVDADSVFTGRVNGSPQRTFLAQSRHELPTEEDGFASRGDCWLFVHQHQLSNVTISHFLGAAHEIHFVCVKLNGIACQCLFDF